MTSREETQYWLKATSKLSIYGVVVGLIVPFVILRSATPVNLAIGGSIGFLMAWVLAALERYLSPRLRTMPFLLEIVAVTLVRVVVMAAIGTLVIFAYLVLSGQESARAAFAIAFRFASPVSEMLPVYGFVLFASFLATFLLSIGRKLGPGVLSGWILGRYRQPLKERRVVMFLDLDDSTAIAEELGDERFSSFVRDFMADLTQPILAGGAQVSHYIGDEVVLTWLLTARRTVVPWPLLIRRASLRLEQRRAYYMSRYGRVPSFKCGVHAGEVITTEVGVLKSELVHHGDVLNVASRLAGLCKPQGQSVLATPEAVAMAVDTQGFEVQNLGELEVKGRRDPIATVALQSAD